MFEKLKNLLKIVNFQGTIVLKDGTEVILDGNLEVGVKVSVIIPDNNEPVDLPDGEYTLDDDSTMVVGDGVIVDIIPVKDDEPETDEPETENQEETPETPETTETPETDDVSVEERLSVLEQKIAELESLLVMKDEHSKLKDEHSKLQNEFSTLVEKLENKPGAKKVSTNQPEVKLSAVDKKYMAIKSYKK